VFYYMSFSGTAFVRSHKYVGNGSSEKKGGEMKQGGLEKEGCTAKRKLRQLNCTCYRNLRGVTQ